MTPLRIAHIAPVATTIPPPKSGSVESMTSLLTEGLVARGHDVTLFATGDSKTTATLHAIYPHGYRFLKEFRLDPFPTFEFEIEGVTIQGESNPFLGVRGVRLLLRNPGLFRTQLRALARASAMSRMMR